MWTAIWATFYFYANYLVGVYEGGGAGLEFVTPALNQDILLRYWPVVIIIIVLEIALSLYKLIKGQWTQRMAIFNTIIELMASIVFIVIIINPNVMSKDFVSYMTNLFTITANQFTTWIVAGGIFFFMVSAAIIVFDGFRKAKIY